MDRDAEELMRIASVRRCWKDVSKAAHAMGRHETSRKAAEIARDFGRELVEKAESIMRRAVLADGGRRV